MTTVAISRGGLRDAAAARRIAAALRVLGFRPEIYATGVWDSAGGNPVFAGTEGVGVLRLGRQHVIARVDGDAISIRFRPGQSFLRVEGRRDPV